MPNIVKVTVENPDEILNAGAYGPAAVIRLRTAATEAGVFADVSGAGSTPTLTVQAATRSYTGYDPNGTVSSWYQTRFENAGGTRLSDWSPAFQVGDETAGMLCSLYDVQQEGVGTGANDAESILEKIRQVSVAIEGYTRRWFTPRPLSGETTYRTTATPGRDIRIGKGIRSVSALGIAFTDQPASGGTYTSVTIGDVYIDPPELERDAGWPGTWLRFRRNPTGSPAEYTDSSYGVEIVGAFGWAAVPADIQGVAIRAVVRRVIGKAAGAAFALGPEGTEFLLPDMSGADRGTLDFYRDRSVG